MNLNKLKEPFPSKDIEWRVQRSGIKNGKPWAMVLAYVTARAIMDRLDDVVGPQNWQDRYLHMDKGVTCDLSLYVPANNVYVPEDCEDNPELSKSFTRYDWIMKQDGAQYTDIEGFKGGISGALKRAAVKWGIGRYLYNLEENFAQCQIEKPRDTLGWHMATTKSKERFWWKEPSLPAWALPSSNGQDRAEEKEEEKPSKKDIVLDQIKEKLSEYTEGFSNTARLDELYKQFEVKDWKEMRELPLVKLESILGDL